MFKKYKKKTDIWKDYFIVTMVFIIQIAIISVIKDVWGLNVWELYQIILSVYIMIWISRYFSDSFSDVFEHLTKWNYK